MWMGQIASQQRAELGVNVSLVCDVCAQPEGHVVWLKEGQPLENATLSSDAKTLTISYLAEEDLANYTCQVTNTILGSDYIREFTVELLEGGPPHPPLYFDAIDTTSFSINVTWLPSRDGGYPKMTFTLGYREEGSEAEYEVIQANVTEPGAAVVESVTRLDSETMYEFMLVAHNTNPDQEHNTSLPVPLKAATRGELLNISTTFTSTVQILLLNTDGN